MSDAAYILSFSMIMSLIILGGMYIEFKISEWLENIRERKYKKEKNDKSD